jgi:speckle-type POZ protein
MQITDIEAPVFRALLHFIYTDGLPEEHDGTNLEVAMAQHLLVAADMYQLTRLSRMCERRLCETVDVETVATTLALAHKVRLGATCGLVSSCAGHLCLGTAARCVDVCLMPCCSMDVVSALSALHSHPLYLPACVPRAEPR